MSKEETAESIRAMRYKLRAIGQDNVELRDAVFERDKAITKLNKRLADERRVTRMLEVAAREIVKEPTRGPALLRLEQAIVRLSALRREQMK